MYNLLNKNIEEAQLICQPFEDTSWNVNHLKYNWAEQYILELAYFDTKGVKRCYFIVSEDYSNKMCFVCRNAELPRVLNDLRFTMSRMFLEYLGDERYKLHIRSFSQNMEDIISEFEIVADYFEIYRSEQSGIEVDAPMLSDFVAWYEGDADGRSKDA